MISNKLKILFLFLLLTPLLEAQVSEYEYKAAFVERFTRFVEWPVSYDASSSDTTFTIVVIGENEFETALNDLFSKASVKGKTAKVIYTDNVKDLEFANLVFISSSEKRHLTGILSVIAEKPILIISDSKGFCESGTHINMYNDGDYIRYEINQSAFKKSGLIVNSLLLASAKVVKNDD